MISRAVKTARTPAAADTPSPLSACKTAVTAVDAAERLYERATQGSYVSLSAPGVEILSTAPNGKYLVSSGTSLATAPVAGAAALLLELWPLLTPLELHALLELTAKDLGPPGTDPLFGSGLIDVCRAAARLDQTVTLRR